MYLWIIQYTSEVDKVCTMKHIEGPIPKQLAR